MPAFRNCAGYTRQWSGIIRILVGDNEVAQLPVPVEITIGADDNVIDLGSRSLDDMGNQWFAQVFLQALVDAVHTLAQSSGKNDAAESMLVHGVLKIE